MWYIDIHIMIYYQIRSGPGISSMTFSQEDVTFKHGSVVLSMKQTNKDPDMRIPAQGCVIPCVRGRTVGSD